MDNNYQYWSDDCLLQINYKIYMYRIHSIIDKDEQVVGKDLTVYENTDPSIADGGAVLRFRNIESFWACGVVDSVLNEKPQVVSLIDGPVDQAFTSSPNLQGKWSLVLIQAFASLSDLPNYKDQEVIWEFRKNNLMNEVTVSKSSSKIKHDYSPAEGKYNVWMNLCVIKIGAATYSFEIRNESEVETLVLTNDLSPSIADNTKYVFMRI